MKAVMTIISLVITFLTSFFYGLLLERLVGYPPDTNIDTFEDLRNKPGVKVSKVLASEHKKPLLSCRMTRVPGYFVFSPQNITH